MIPDWSTRGRECWHRIAATAARFPIWLPLLVMLSVGGISFFLVSCASVQRSVVIAPTIEGATFVGNQTCYECHTNYARSFASTPHARVRVEHTAMNSFAGCEACHGPGSKHVAAGGGRGRFIVNPGKEPSACLTCHLSVQAEFHLPQHHPVLEGRMNCVQCHDPHGADIFKPAGGLALSRLNEQCANCHREQSKPHVFEHEALREGCTICHQPHGSINAKMLAQRDNNLCLRCHVQIAAPGLGRGLIAIGKVDHSDYLVRGTCWSAGCHTSVHGSQVHPRMFY